MAHRIRYTMKQELLSSKLNGIVGVDETHAGGKQKGVTSRPSVYRSKKTPVISLVERSGNVRSFPMERVTSKNPKPIFAECVAQNSTVNTDEDKVYHFVRKVYARHDVVNHSAEEYVR